MIKTRFKGCVIRYLALVLVAFLLSFGMVKISHALTEEELDFYAQNNILFYDPGASNNLCSGAGYNNQVTWTDLNPLSTAEERYELIVQTYGPLTQQLQKYYGIPWEMPLAMMILESGVGMQSDPNSPNMKAKEIGDYDLLSLVDANNTFSPDGSGEKYDPYTDPNNRVQSASICDSNGNCGLEEGTPGSQKHVFKNFTSISNMIVDYVIYHVRSGTGLDGGYDAGLQMLTPDKYEENLQSAITKIMSPYCVDASGGDCYSGNLYTYIRDYSSGYGEILKKVMDRNGWMNSGELAKAWDIQPGGLATTEMKWGDDGWGDIRQEAWEAYGVLGLPEEVANKLGSNGTGCGTRLRGSCFELNDSSDGGCTKDEFTFFNQGGNTWATIEYACENIKDAGCGPSAVAMVITALTDSLVTPDMVVEKIVTQEGGANKTGTIQICKGGSYGAVATIAEQYGLKAEHAKPSSVEEINKWLDEGKMMTFTVGPYPMRYIDENDQEKIGTVTDGGHFIAIRGRDDDGRWLTFDSAGWTWFGHGMWKGDFRSDRRYNPDDVFAAYLDHISSSGGMYLISR